jgi:hypothetical protein
MEKNERLIGAASAIAGVLAAVLFWVAFIAGVRFLTGVSAWRQLEALVFSTTGWVAFAIGVIFGGVVAWFFWWLLRHRWLRSRQSNSVPGVYRFWSFFRARKH